MAQTISENKKRKEWSSMIYQLTAPLLDACVLGIVAQEDSYGYTLTQKVRELVDISESTLYPVLRRLQKDALLETYDQPYQGRNRRYYRITGAGQVKLDFYRKEWDIYKGKISLLLSGPEKETVPAVQKEVARELEEREAGLLPVSAEMKKGEEQ